jgi:hypothetical protein
MWQRPAKTDGRHRSWYIPTVPTVALVPHPGTPCDAVRHIAARVDRRRATHLVIRYEISADFARLRIPTAAALRAPDRLWEHTCCEAFVAVDGIGGYHELNFSPCGAWAAYAFTGYRERAAATDPVIACTSSVVQRAADRLWLDADLDLAGIGAAMSSLAIALATVIETTDGRLSYWALAHPAARPDFHHRAGFALRLEAAVVG